MLTLLLPLATYQGGAGSLRSNILLHLHIPKTGGTTLEKMALPGHKRCQHKPESIIVDGGNPTHELMVNQTVKILADLPHSKCNYLSCECDASFYQQFAPASVKPVILVLMREPVAHLSSVIDHNIRMARKKPALGVPGIDWQRVVMNETALPYGHDPRNMQTRWLGPGLAQATATLQSPTTLVMLTEFYDTSVCVLYFYLAAYNQTQCDCRLREHMHHQNRNTSTHAAATREMILSVASVLVDDFELYGTAVREFRKQVEVVENAIGHAIFCVDRSIGQRRYDPDGTGGYNYIKAGRIIAG